jgi:xylulokinase
MLSLGFDIGSSSVKVALVDASTGQTLGALHSPDTEMPIDAPQPGWAEQHPDLWWEHCCRATRMLLERTGTAAEDIGTIGIAYQMHGLVCVGDAGEVVRPSIIWCDSRAVGIGQQAFEVLGEAYCLEHYLNAPGNFTASKLKWVRDNEPHLYKRIKNIMLPGDYIAFRMTGEACTTISGLSEGILWDFKQQDLATDLLKYYDLDTGLIPRRVPTFGPQGQLTAVAAEALGLRSGIEVRYRAGDQPNNALSLNVLAPGEVAATGGTSGVVYGVVDRLASDAKNRVNSFAHVNHSAEAARVGVLLCINGAGIQYGWMRKQVAGTAVSYADMEAYAAGVPIGSDGLRMLPFGNGAERMLGNRDVGAQWHGLQFNRHSQPHLFRAALEGVAFSFVYGMHIMRDLGLDLSVIRVGDDNLFQSRVFAQTIAELLGCRIEMLHTTGAVGAAIAASAADEAGTRKGLERLQLVQAYTPEGTSTDAYQAAYEGWRGLLAEAF